MIKLYASKEIIFYPFSVFICIDGRLNTSTDILSPLSVWLIMFLIICLRLRKQKGLTVTLTGQDNCCSSGMLLFPWSIFGQNINDRDGNWGFDLQLSIKHKPQQGKMLIFVCSGLLLICFQNCSIILLSFTFLIMHHPHVNHKFLSSKFLVHHLWSLICMLSC